MIRMQNFQNMRHFAKYFRRSYCPRNSDLRGGQEVNFQAASFQQPNRMHLTKKKVHVPVTEEGQQLSDPKWQSARLRSALYTPVRPPATDTTAAGECRPGDRSTGRRENRYTFHRGGV